MKVLNWDGSVVEHNLIFCRTLSSLCPPTFVPAANPILPYSPVAAAVRATAVHRRPFASTPTANEVPRKLLGVSETGIQVLRCQLRTMEVSIMRVNFVMISEPSHVPCVSVNISSRKCSSDTNCPTQKDATCYDRCDTARTSLLLNNSTTSFNQHG